VVITVPPALLGLLAFPKAPSHFGKSEWISLVTLSAHTNR